MNIIFAFLVFLVGSWGTYIPQSGYIYEGEWVSGHKQAYGRCIYNNGDVYIGQWSNSFWHGDGRCIYANGGEYVGEWLNGNRHGFAKRIYSDGDYCTGKWNYDDLSVITSAELTRSLLGAVNSVSNREEGGFACYSRVFIPQVLRSLADIQTEDRDPLLRVSNGLERTDQENLKDILHSIQDGALTFIHTGWDTHCVFLVFYNDTLLICNRGDGGEKSTTKMFHFKKENLSLAHLTRLICEKSNSREERLPYLYKEFPNSIQAVEDKRCQEFEKRLREGPQKVGNCWYASCEEAMKGALALIFLEQGLSIESATTKAKELKKLYSAVARLQLVAEYKQKVDTGLIDPIRQDSLVLIEQKTMKAYKKNIATLGPLSRHKYPWLPS